MATKIWQGQAPAVAQISRVNASSVVSGDTYQILVGGELIAEITADGTTTALQVAQALASGWNAATGNPYVKAITADTYTTGSIPYFRATADVAGVPFAFTTNVTGGGGGTFGATGVLTANESPNDWNNARNWSASGVPASTDDVVFRDSDSDVLWGLDQSAVDLASLAVEQTYTGRIGLNVRAFVTGAAGAENGDRPEYRETSGGYLDIGWDECRIGENPGPGTPAGSGRLKLDNDKAGASTTTVYDTASAGSDSGMPPVRLLLNNASADLLVRSAPGGVGIAADVPGETSTLNDVDISDTTLASRVFCGEGVTLGQWSQQGGQNVLRAAATVTGIKCLGGELAIEGSGYAVTQLDVIGGLAWPNNVPSAGNAVTTTNVQGGTVDGTRSRAARTWGTVNLQRPGATLIHDPDVVTITTLAAPTDSGPNTLTVG